MSAKLTRAQAELLVAMQKGSKVRRTMNAEYFSQHRWPTVHVTKIAKELIDLKLAFTKGGIPPMSPYTLELTPAGRAWKPAEREKE